MMDYAGRVAQADTFPKLLRLNAREHGGEIALREKDLGRWRIFTWNDYHTRAHDFALGMVELGLGHGDVIGIIGDNRPDWVAAEIAAHAIGAMSLGLYRDVLDEEAAYLLSYGEAKLVFAEDEEQVDKLLALADRAPNLKHIVYSDSRGMRKYDDPRLMEADKLVAMGRDRAAREPGLYDRLVDATGGEDVAILCTTSGTTANPKLAMLAGGRVLKHCATYLAFDPKGTGRRICLGAAAALDHGTGLRARQSAALPDEGELRRRTRDHDERFPRDRADLRAVRAETMGIDRRRRPRRRDGRITAEAKTVRRRHEDRTFGARPGQTVCSGRPIVVPRIARPAGLYAAAIGRNRRRCARAGYVQVLPGHGRAFTYAVRPDRNARRLHAASLRQGRSGYDWRTNGSRYRGPRRQPRRQRRRRNRGAPPQHVPRLLQEPGSFRRRYQRRLDAVRRRRLFQSPTGSSSSSTVSRTSPRPRAATASRRNIWKTS